MQFDKATQRELLLPHSPVDILLIPGGETFRVNVSLITETGFNKKLDLLLD